MKYGEPPTDKQFLEVIGGRLARIRLSQNLTQGQLAERAGLGLRTIQRLELGSAATQLSGFARVCRVLGLMENLDMFIPEPLLGPMDQLRNEGYQRQRASREMMVREDDAPSKWKWGDET